MALGIAQFLAVIFTVLALVPAGAHLAALPGKIGLARDEYFAVQGIYTGWAWFGIVQAGAILCAAALTFIARGSGTPFILALVGCVLLIATMVLFFIFVFPANQATSNWTQMPDNWEQLRTRWEYTHALNAILTFLALVALTLAVIVDGRAS